MSRPPNLNLVHRFKARAELALPGRVAQVILFGSRARATARPGSDWDLAVFLRGGATCTDTAALSDAAYDLILESGEAIHPIALPEDGRGVPSLLLGEIVRDGIPV